MRPRRIAAIITSLALLVGLTTPVAAADDAHALTLSTISSRADTVSDGDTLIEIRGDALEGVEGIAASADAPGVSFQMGEVDGRVLALVDGLPLGQTTLRVTLPDGSGAELDVTNHPPEGPIFSGQQITPWLCSTANAGLGGSQQDVCHVQHVTYRWYYRSAVDYSFQDYDPDNPPPPVVIATTTTDEGHTVPFIVRVERGTLNRGIYDVAMLADPSRSTWSPFDEQDRWNGKLYWRIGTNTGVTHRQGIPNAMTDDFQNSAVPGVGWDGPVLHNEALGRGHAVVVSTTVNNGKMYKPLVAAETMSMVNERIAERYGPIRQIVPEGWSGAASMQIGIASAYPGLLDGLVTGASVLPFAAIVDVADCVVLRRYFEGPGTADGHFASPADQAKAMGHGSSGPCQALTAMTADAIFDPSKGCLNMNEEDPPWAYDKTTGEGTRCTVADAHAGPWPVDPETGIVNPPWDNEGVQYGLEALLRGGETGLDAEQFIHLNAQVGGFDADFQPTAARMRGDLDTIRAMYHGGFLADGRNLTDLPILDYRGHNYGVEFHPGIMSVQLRGLIDQAGGGHMATWTNELPFFVGGGYSDAPQPGRAWDTMNDWLDEIERLSAASPAEDRDTTISRARPSIAVDSCWVAEQQITDRSQCETIYPTSPDTRMLAGSPLNWPLKCALTELDRSAYPNGTFEDEEWEAMQQIFPTGVCDWTQPGMGAVEPVASGWITFADGQPGGQPMGPEPTSRRVN